MGKLIGMAPRRTLATVAISIGLRPLHPRFKAVRSYSAEGYVGIEEFFGSVESRLSAGLQDTSGALADIALQVSSG